MLLYTGRREKPGASADAADAAAAAVVAGSPQFRDPSADRSLKGRIVRKRKKKERGERDVPSIYVSARRFPEPARAAAATPRRAGLRA